MRGLTRRKPRWRRQPRLTETPSFLSSALRLLFCSSDSFVLLLHFSLTPSSLISAVTQITVQLGRSASFISKSGTYSCPQGSLSPASRESLEMSVGPHLVKHIFALIQSQESPCAPFFLLVFLPQEILIIGFNQESHDSSSRLVFFGDEERQ